MYTEYACIIILVYKKESIAEGECMQKIVISHITFGDEKFPAPVGLSELVENAWVHKDEIQLDTIVDSYDRKVEKVNGRWRTIYKKKVN